MLGLVPRHQPTIRTILKMELVGSVEERNPTDFVNKNLGVKIYD